MNRSAWWFTGAAVAAAWSLDLLFWKKPVGINVLIWVMILLAGAALLAWQEKVRPSRWSYALAAVVLAGAIFSVVRAEPFTRLANIGLALGCVALMAATFTTGSWINFPLRAYIGSGFQLLGNSLIRAPELARTDTVQEGEAPVKTSAWRQIAPVLRGLLLALPVVFVLGALLSSADMVFSKSLGDLLRNFDLNRIGEYLFRLFYILVFAYAFAGLYLGALRPKSTAPLPDPAQPAIKPFLGFTETAVVLLCVDLLFLFFVVIQFRYLFGGQANITAAGFSYSEYARRGFGELVWVAVLSLMLYVGLATVGKQAAGGQRRFFTAAAVLLVALVIVILASALQRLLLYEQAYGFSRLRTYTHVFIFWLAALLAAVIALELLRRRGRFALALLLMTFGFTLTLGVINIDGFIARQNIQLAAQSGKELDASYLNTLSADAVPTLLRAYDDASLSAEIHQRLGAVLACRASAFAAAKGKSWAGFHFAENNAATALQSRDWSAYPLVNEKTGKSIQMDTDSLYCSSLSID